MSIIIFVDIRGFTTWAEIEADEACNVLVQKFAGILLNYFPNSLVKTLGDGGMIVSHPDKEVSEKSLCLDALAHIIRVECDFQDLVETLNEKCGTGKLHLGWGLARGLVRRVNILGKIDYLGTDVNKAAFLCSLAKPRGVVLDYDDFKVIKNLLPGYFVEVVAYRNRQLKIFKSFAAEKTDAVG